MLEALVMPRDVLPGRLTARESLDRERMHVKLDDRVCGPDQSEELPLGRLQRGIRHHVQQPDMHLPDVLMLRHINGEHGLSLVDKTLKRRQRGVGNQWHGVRILRKGSGPSH